MGHSGHERIDMPSTGADRATTTVPDDIPVSFIADVLQTMQWARQERNIRPRYGERYDLYKALIQWLRESKASRPSLPGSIRVPGKECNAGLHAQSDRIDDLLYVYHVSAVDEIRHIVQAETEAVTRQIASVARYMDNSFGQQVQDHRDMLARCRRMEGLLEQAQHDSAKLRVLLDKAYPVERLAAIAGATVFACVFSLAAWAISKVHVVHPVLAIIGILAGGAFLGLARWRKRNAG